MGELVPLHDVKQADFAQWNEQALFRYDTDQLTSEEARLISKHIDLRLYFGFHGTEADHYLEVEKTFDDFDPANTIVCFERAGFSVHDEAEARHDAAHAPVSKRMRMQREAVLRSRNSQGINYLLSLNSFGYAQSLCMANGYDIRLVDIDRWTEQHWRRYITETSVAENEPILGEASGQFMKDEWQQYDLMEAVLTHRALSENSTNIIPLDNANPLVILRWGEYHRIREEAVIRKLKGISLEEAQRLELDDSRGEKKEKSKVALFFGAAHARGIEMRLLRLGLAYNATYMSNLKHEDSTLDVPVSGNVVRGFIKSWMAARLYELYDEYYPQDDKHKLRSKVDATLDCSDDIDLGSLADLYEAYRSYTLWYENETVPQTSNLKRALLEDRKHRERPSVIFQNLVSNTFARNGKNLDELLHEHTKRKKSYVDELFGMV